MTPASTSERSDHRRLGVAAPELSRAGSVRTTYDALNEQELALALGLLAADVEWPDTILRGHRLRGRGAVHRHWLRVFGMFRPRIEPLGLWQDASGNVVVEAHQRISDLAGKPLAHQDVRHVFSFDGAGLIARLDADEPRAGDGN